ELLFFDGRQILLGAAVRLDVNRRIEAGKAVADPVLGGTVRQTAQGDNVDYIGADSGDHGHGAEGHFIELAPRLVGGVTVVTAGDLELGDLERLLFLDAYAPLRQLQHPRLA